MFDPLCVVQVQPGESLSLIADRFDDDTVRVDTIQAENDIENATIYPDQLLDVCVDNGLDDRTGATRPPNEVLVAEATMANVQIQQTKLNELFAGYGMADLPIDGVSGAVTRQRLCAARMALGLPVSTLDMAAGSEEEIALMAATQLNIPVSAPVEEERWVLVDQTCQVMFVGAGSTTLQFIFPTSTGQPGLRDSTPGPLEGVPLRPCVRQRRLARQHRLPGSRGQSAEREHVQAPVLRRRTGDPRRQQRAHQPAEQGLRPLAPGEPEHADRLAGHRWRDDPHRGIRLQPHGSDPGRLRPPCLSDSTWTQPPRRRCSRCETERYLADGYLVVPDLVSPEQVAEVNAEAVRFARGEFPTINAPAVPTDLSDADAMARLLAVHFPHWVSPVVRSMIDIAPIAEVLQRITAAHVPGWDGSVKCMQSMLFVKPPGFQGQAWHQDEVYIPTRPLPHRRLDRPGRRNGPERVPLRHPRLAPAGSTSYPMVRARQPRRV